MIKGWKHLFIIGMKWVFNFLTLGGIRMQLAIITGVSKGLGKSTARFLLESGIHVFGVSRTANKQLLQLAEENNVTYKHFPCDLGDLTRTNIVVEDMKSELNLQKLSQLFIVNNAAVVDPIHQAAKTSGIDLAYH